MAGIRTWNSLGRFVKRREKGILILAPMIGRKKADSAAELTEAAKPPQAQLRGFRAVYLGRPSAMENCGRGAEGHNHARLPVVSLNSSP